MNKLFVIPIIFVFLFNLSAPAVFAGERLDIYQISKVQADTFGTLISVSNIIGLPVGILNSIINEKATLTNSPKPITRSQKTSKKTNDQSSNIWLTNTGPNINKVISTCSSFIFGHRSFILSPKNVLDIKYYLSFIKRNSGIVLLLLILTLIVYIKNQSDINSSIINNTINPFHISEWVFLFLTGGVPWK